MKRIYLILFSIVFFLPIYGRDPDIPLKMDVTLPSVVYFSKSDSMSTMLLFPYIYPDTMNKLFVEIEPYHFNKFSSYVSLYKKDLSYTLGYFFQNDSLFLPLSSNSIGFEISDIVQRNFLFSVYSNNKSIGDKHYSMLNFKIFKSIGSNKFLMTNNINQLIGNKRTSGAERMLTIRSSLSYSMVNTHGLFMQVCMFNNHLTPAFGYSNRKKLYRNIKIGAELLDKKILPFVNMKFYFYKGFFSLFYNPKYDFHNFYTVMDTIPNAFISKIFYQYKVNHYSGINLKFMGINIYGNYGEYTAFPHFDTLSNAVMSYMNIRILHSGMNVHYENKFFKLSSGISNNYALKDTLSLPDFSAYLYTVFRSERIKLTIGAISDFDYIKSYKFKPLSLLLNGDLGFKFSNNFSTTIYGEYTPYYKIYGEFYKLPAYKYGVLFRLKGYGF